MPPDFTTRLTRSSFCIVGCATASRRPRDFDCGQLSHYSAHIKKMETKMLSTRRHRAHGESQCECYSSRSSFMLCGTPCALCLCVEKLLYFMLPLSGLSANQ